MKRLRRVALRLFGHKQIRTINELMRKSNLIQVGGNTKKKKKSKGKQEKFNTNT